jgi:hypothetical protein
MELLNPSKSRQERQAWIAQGAILLSAICFSIFWLTALALQTTHAGFSPRALPMPHLEYNKIGKGVFAISPKVVSREFEPLVQELVLLGKNTRPDAGALSRICLGLKTSGARQELISGQKLFLAEQGASYQFSDIETDLSLLPLSLAGSEILLQIQTTGGKKEEIVLTPSLFFQESPDDESYVQSLKKGKMWAPDLFLHQCGGEEYRLLSAKHKVEIENKVYFLSVGDTLWWDGSEWKMGIPPLVEAPAAKLVSASSQGMVLKVWDSTGYLSYSIELPLHQELKSPLKVEEVITSIRSRSPSEITCQLGKRRVVVKEGDWWIKTDRRWRSLRTADDLEAFLHHDIQGELFIFEKVESAKGRVTLKGRCFDKMRTESQPLLLVVNTEKKSPSSTRYKEPPHASLLAKNKMTVPPIQHQNSDGEGKR